MVLGAMAWISRVRDAGGDRNFELFDAMLRYIENVPDRLHQPGKTVVPGAIRRRHCN
jgi:hypothetical protein